MEKITDAKKKQQQNPTHKVVLALSTPNSAFFLHPKLPLIVMQKNSGECLYPYVEGKI